MREKDEKLYESRFYLFGIIPLWKETHTKREWIDIISLDFRRNRIIEVEFIDEEEEDGREI
ncbi:hypothetical protein [Streptococcus suis]|uniref:hypothetical protein n=1 Tax=Streptococcus suis TaxID=1307 RepID=UPI0038BA5092